LQCATLLADGYASVAKDGTHSRRTRSLGVLRPAVTLLVASVALLALTRRKYVPAVEAPELSPSLVAPPLLPLPISQSRSKPSGRLPRFLGGTLAGVTTGVTLGMVAVAALSIASAEVRRAVIVGAGFDKPPMTDGHYVARVMAQAMNPTLAYADEATLAELLARPPAETPDAVVVSPVEQQLEDNAMLVFGVLAGLTVLSWSGIMWGLSGGRRPLAPE
jgi:hypothetical protein